MRLIDGSALLKELRKMQRECEKDGEEMGGEAVLLAEGIDSACEIVKAAKTVDPVKHGKWIKYYAHGFTDYLECSICKGKKSSIFESKYCPYCGAEMELR